MAPRCWARGRYSVVPSSPAGPLPADVRDHADHRTPGVGVSLTARELDAPADRALARPPGLGQAPADEHDALRAARVGLGEGAAFDDGHAEGGQVVGAHGRSQVGRGPLSTLGGRVRPALDREHAEAETGPEGLEDGRQPHRADEGKGAKALLQRRVEAEPGGFVGMTRGRRRDLGHDAALRAESDVDGELRSQAPGQQGGRDGEGDGRRGLDGDEQVETAARRAADAPARARSRRLLARARRAKRRQRAGGQRGDDREHRGEAEDHAVDANPVRPRNVGGQERDQGRHAGPGDGEARRAPEQADERALGQELPDDAAAAGPEGDAQRQLVPAGGGAHLLQVGQVHGPDQPHRGDRREQQEQHRAHLAQPVLPPRPEGDARPVVVGHPPREQPGELRAERPHLVRRRLQGDAGTEAADQERGARPQPDRARRVHGHRHPEVRAGRREVEVRRHDAPHLVGDPVERQRPSDDGRIGAEALPPQRVAQEGGRCRAGALVVEAEARTQRRRAAQAGQQIARDRHDAHAQGLVESGEGPVDRRDVGGDVEGARPLSQLDELADVADVEDADQPVRFLDRQRAQKNAVEGAEDGRRRSDREGQGGDRHCREPGAAAEGARAAPYVLLQLIEPAPPPQGPDVLADEPGVAERRPCRPRGVRRRHAPLEVLLRLELEVQGELAPDVRLRPLRAAAAEPREHTSEWCAQRHRRPSVYADNLQ